MKKIIFALSLVLVTFSIKAQPTIRNARVADTTKKPDRSSNIGSNMNVPGVRSINKRSALNSGSQVAVASIDSNHTLFTEDPTIKKLVMDIAFSLVPVNLTLTPMNPCPSDDNCIFSSNIITEIGIDNLKWRFLRNDTRRIGESLSFFARLQPNKDYLMVFDLDVAQRPSGLEFEILGHNIKGFNQAGQSFNLPVGKSQVALLFHTDAEYKFAKHGPGQKASFFKVWLRNISSKESSEDKYRIDLLSMKIKEMDLK